MHFRLPIPFEGERYDFILETNQAPADYWIRLQAYGDCKWAGGHGSAILHYVDCDLCEDEVQQLPVGEEFDDTLHGTARLHHHYIPITNHMSLS